MNYDLPNNAKRVFKGLLFDTYRWEQIMFDGKLGLFEKVIRLPVSQLLVITQNNKIILCHEEQPHIGKYIGIPGGIIERNELPLENAKKELLEELGMVSTNIKLWKKIEMKGKVNWDTYFYIVKEIKKTHEPNLENGEKIEPFEVNFKEFIDYTQNINFRGKELKNIIFKMIQTYGELEKFEKELFNYDDNNNY